MIPAGLLSYELAKKIMQTGKAVNFIRRCCQEQDWILDPANRPYELGLRSNNYSTSLLIRPMATPAAPEMHGKYDEKSLKQKLETEENT